MKDVVYEYVWREFLGLRGAQGFVGMSPTKRSGLNMGEARWACVLSYAQMQSDLESEKRAMMRIWKKREKQISIVGMSPTKRSGLSRGGMLRMRLVLCVVRSRGLLAGIRRWGVSMG